MAHMHLTYSTFMMNASVGTKTSDSVMIPIPFPHAISLNANRVGPKGKQNKA